MMRTVPIHQPHAVLDRFVHCKPHFISQIILPHRAESVIVHLKYVTSKPLFCSLCAKETALSEKNQDFLIFVWSLQVTNFLCRTPNSGTIKNQVAAKNLNFNAIISVMRKIRPKMAFFKRCKFSASESHIEFFL